MLKRGINGRTAVRVWWLLLVMRYAKKSIPCAIRSNQPTVRQNADFVIKAEAAKEWLAASAERQTITGDALGKFAELFAPFGTLAPESDWHPTGAGLLRCVEAAWRDGAFAPDDRALGNPLALLPVYTRLSDAEEHERIKLAKMPEGAERAQELRRGWQTPKKGVMRAALQSQATKMTDELRASRRLRSAFRSARCFLGGRS